MDLTTSNSEILLLCIVVFLGIILLALIFQVYMLYRLSRELRQARDTLDSAHETIGKFSEEITPFTDIFRNRLVQGKGFLQAFDEVTEVIHSTTAQLETILQKLFTQFDDITANMEEAAEENSSAENSTDRDAQSDDVFAQEKDQTARYREGEYDQNEELMVYERQRK